MREFEKKTEKGLNQTRNCSRREGSRLKKLLLRLGRGPEQGGSNILPYERTK